MKQQLFNTLTHSPQKLALADARRETEILYDTIPLFLERIFIEQNCIESAIEAPLGVYDTHSKLDTFLWLLSGMLNGLDVSPIDARMGTHEKNKFENHLNTSAFNDRPDVISHRENYESNQSIDVISALNPSNYENNLSDSTGKLILTTSGTSGNPKLVPLNCGNITSSVKASNKRLGVTPDDTWLSPLPVIHTGGIMPAFRTLLSGATCIFCQSNVKTILEAIKKYSVTCISLVPTLLRDLLKTGKRWWSDLRVVLLGGAKIPKKVIEKCTERTLPVCATYGLTETTSQVCTALPNQVSDSPESVGPPLENLQVTIVSDGKKCDLNESGEIVVSGPTVFDGYLNRSALNQSVFGKYGFHTGDIGEFNQQGYLKITGRSDQMIHTGGEIVAPREVEAVLKNHPDIIDAAVAGQQNDRWGEQVTAWIVSDTTVSRNKLKEYCTEKLATYKCPKQIKLRDHLPRTRSGTIDWKQLITS